MPKVNGADPNCYVFARVVNGKYNLGSDRRALTLFWLARLPADLVEQWGRGKLSDDAIMHEADKRGLEGTGPWLEARRPLGSRRNPQSLERFEGDLTDLA